MRLEEGLGRKEAALEACERAAATLMGLAQTRSPTEENPASKMNAEQLGILERTYAAMVPLYAKLAMEDKSQDPRDRAAFVEKYGSLYLELFPNGKSRTEVVNAMNAAKSCMADAGTDIKDDTAKEKTADE